MSRIAARRHAFVLIYQTGFCEPDELEQRIGCYLEEEQVEEDSRQFILKLVWGVLEKQEEIDKLINENAKGWSVDRMNRVDAAIMRLAIYEMLYMEEIPQSVSLNEAVELAKRYSSDDAPSFINGVLGGIERSRI